MDFDEKEVAVEVERLELKQKINYFLKECGSMSICQSLIQC